MPWGLFIVGLIVVFLMQVGLVGALNLPFLDLFAVYALVLGLLLPTWDARLAAWVIGLVQDLGSDDALGLHAFSLGFAVVLLTRLRELVNLDPSWMRLLVAALAALPAMLIVLLYGRLWMGALAPSWGKGFLLSVMIAGVAGALATALTYSPRLRRRFAMQRRRHRYY